MSYGDLIEALQLIVSPHQDIMCGGRLQLQYGHVTACTGYTRHKEAEREGLHAVHRDSTRLSSYCVVHTDSESLGVTQFVLCDSL